MRQWPAQFGRRKSAFDNPASKVGLQLTARLPIIHLRLANSYQVRSIACFTFTYFSWTALQ
jgi:hypothetical protein